MRRIITFLLLFSVYCAQAQVRVYQPPDFPGTTLSASDVVLGSHQNADGSWTDYSYALYNLIFADTASFNGVTRPILDSGLATRANTLTIVNISGSAAILPNYFVRVGTGSAQLDLPLKPADKTLNGFKLTTQTPGYQALIATQGGDRLNIIGGGIYDTLKLLNQTALFEYHAADSTWVKIDGSLPLSVLDTRYGNGSNISNASLTFNGSYIQNVAGYNLQFKGIGTAIFSDKNGFPWLYADTALSLSGRAAVGVIRNSGGDEVIAGDSVAAISLQANPGGIEVEISTGINLTPALQIDDTQHINLTNLPTDYSPNTDSLVIENVTTHFLNRVPYKYLVTPKDSSGTTFSTVTYNWTNYGSAKITAQAGSMTITNPAGTLQEGEVFTLTIADGSSARALTWGTQYAPTNNAAIPSTTYGNGLPMFVILYYSAVSGTGKVYIMNVD